MEKRRYLQLGDIAAELNVSASTVSRAISGKGNLSAETRKRINEFIEIHGYQPNAAAQRLAEGRTGNIGVVLPFDAFSRMNNFFQISLLGICQEASKHNYDVVVTTVHDDDIGYLKRLISRRSVDGVILMRSLMDDPSMKYLLDTGEHFVTIGSSENEHIVQVDFPHAEACQNLTDRVLAKTNKTPALIMGDMNYIVNRNRAKGYTGAVVQDGRGYRDDLVFTNIVDETGLWMAVEHLIASDTDSLVCGDDNICLSALSVLDKLDVNQKIVNIASMYDNSALRIRKIMSVSVDDMSLGAVAVMRLLEQIENRPTESDKTIPAYRINC